MQEQWVSEQRKGRIPEGAARFFKSDGFPQPKIFCFQRESQPPSRIGRTYGT